MASLHYYMFYIVNVYFTAHGIMNVFPTSLRVFSHFYECIGCGSREDIHYSVPTCLDKFPNRVIHYSMPMIEVLLSGQIFSVEPFMRKPANNEKVFATIFCHRHAILSSAR
jgi:hypothetical protein